MAKTALALLVVLSAIPMMAFASDSPYSAGYAAGYRFGGYIGQVASDAGPYLGLFACAVAIFHLRFRKRRPPRTGTKEA